MKIKLKKQAQKYLDSVDENTRKKLVKFNGTKNRYRYKIDHYRILFEWNKSELTIVVVEINTRTNIKY